MIPKFRAWDKANQKEADYAIYPNHLIFYNANDGKWIADNERFILMQSTGLKDKNGVEIYEGDILLSTASENRNDWKKWQVHYADGSFQIDYKNIPKDKRRRTNLELEDLCEDNVWFYGLKVIGNIYENPEWVEV